jgi:hypothetical protein
MAGLEVVVRPVVFPNIRPAPARSLPPADDPDKGFATIRGNGAKQIDLSSSFSGSTSSNQRTEQKRQVDEVRVYQKDDNGTVNKDNFIDLQVANKIWMEGSEEPTSGLGSTAELSPTRPRVEVEHYRPIQEADNIEIKKHNHILRSGEEVQAGPV